MILFEEVLKKIKVFIIQKILKVKIHKKANLLVFKKMKINKKTKSMKILSSNLKKRKKLRRRIINRIDLVVQLNIKRII